MKAKKPNKVKFHERLARNKSLTLFIDIHVRRERRGRVGAIVVKKAQTHRRRASEATSHTYTQTHAQREWRGDSKSISSRFSIGEGMPTWEIAACEIFR